MHAYSRAVGTDLHIQYVPAVKKTFHLRRVLTFYHEGVKLWGSAVEMCGCLITGRLPLDFGSLLAIRNTVKSIWRWCRINRPEPLEEQHKMLCIKLRGHYQYYAVNHNYQAPNDVWHHSKGAWHHWLSKRCSKGILLWDNFEGVINEVPIALTADTASDMISWAAELCARRSEICLVMHGRKACVF